MDNFCSANFLQKPKETMNRLRDIKKNKKKTGGGVGEGESVFSVL